MRRHLPEEVGEPVEIEHETFVATGERAPGIAAKRVTEHDPDLVLLTVANYMFSVPFVWLRVQRLFGRRAGLWLRGIEQSINATTYERGRGRGRLNSALRKITHTVIGGDAITMREESTQIYAEMFKELARHEDGQIAATTYAGQRNVLRSSKQIAERAAYVKDVRALAEERHFLFIDTVPAFADKEGSRTVLQSDRLHGTGRYQTVMGKSVAAALLVHAGTRESIPTPW